MYLWSYQVAGPVVGMQMRGEAHSPSEAIAAIQKSIRKTYSSTQPKVSWHQNQSDTETLYTIKGGSAYSGMAQIAYVTPAEFALLINWPRVPTAHMNPFYQTVAVKDLPEVLKRALVAVGYARSSIEIHTGTTFTVYQVTDDDRKSFCSIADLNTGEYRVAVGEYGGGMLGTRNLVDTDRTPRPILDNMAVVQGSFGNNKPASATITVNSATALPAIESASVSLSKDEKKALYAVGGLNSAGRKREFEYEGLGDYGPTNPLIQALAQKNLLEISKSGQVKLTLEGTNLYRKNNAFNNPVKTGAAPAVARVLVEGGEQERILDRKWAAERRQLNQNLSNLPHLALPRVGQAPVSERAAVKYPPAITEILNEKGQVVRVWAKLKCKCGKPPIDGNRVYPGYIGPPVCSKCGSD